MKTATLKKLTINGTSHIWKIAHVGKNNITITRPENNKTIIREISHSEFAAAAKGWEQRESW